jgi:putative tricarboxylic transport membrane protein
MISKRAVETLFTFCLLAFSLWVAFESWGLSLGDLNELGSGFFLFSGAILMGVLCIYQLVRGWRSPGKSGPGFSPYQDMKRLAWTLLISFFYVLFFNPFGFILTSAAFMLLLLALVGKESWLLAAVVAGVVVVSGYVIFDVFLRIPLPVGLLGF